MLFYPIPQSLGCASYVARIILARKFINDGTLPFKLRFIYNRLLTLAVYVVHTEGGGKSSTLPRQRMNTISGGNDPNRASTINIPRKSPSPLARGNANRMSWSGSRAHALQVSLLLLQYSKDMKTGVI